MYMETKFLQEVLFKYFDNGGKQSIVEIKDILEKNNISTLNSKKIIELIENFNRFNKTEDFPLQMRIRTEIFKTSKEIGLPEDFIIGLLRGTPSIEKEQISEHVKHEPFFQNENESIEKERIRREQEEQAKRKLQIEKEKERLRQLDEQKRKVVEYSLKNSDNLRNTNVESNYESKSLNKKNKKTINFSLVVLSVLLVGGVILFLIGRGNKKTDVVAHQNKYPSKGNYGIMSKVKERDTLRVAFEANSAPMYFDDENGTKTGFEVEIAKRIAKQLNVKLIFVEEDYSKLPSVVLSDIADVFMGGYIADSNINHIEWSDPYLDDIGFCLIAPKTSAIKSINDLKGKKVGIYADQRAREWVESNINSSEIKEYETEGSWVQFCDNPKEVDAIIYDYPYAVEEIKEFPDLRIKEVGLGNFSYQIGVPEQNRDLLNVINGVIISFRNTDEYGRLIKKYLKSDALDVKEIEKGAKTYRVKFGDTLSLIASKELGSTEKWRNIWDLNKSRIPNPNLIEVGDELIMP